MNKEEGDKDVYYMMSITQMTTGHIIELKIIHLLELELFKYIIIEFIYNI